MENAAIMYVRHSCNEIRENAGVSLYYVSKCFYIRIRDRKIILNAYVYLLAIEITLCDLVIFQCRIIIVTVIFLHFLTM